MCWKMHWLGDVDIPKPPPMMLSDPSSHNTFSFDHTVLFDARLGNCSEIAHRCMMTTVTPSAAFLSHVFVCFSLQQSTKGFKNFSERDQKQVPLLCIYGGKFHNTTKLTEG